jgi:hypothetical protein
MVVLLGATLTVAACQGGYPIAATRCDYWCYLTKATLCGYYNPAGCVVHCEQVSGGPACYGQFDDLLRCLEAHEQALVCRNSAPARPCEAEQTSLVACAALHSPQGPLGAE